MLSRSGVDAASKRRLWTMIDSRDATDTVVLTTHSMEEAEALADRIGIQVWGEKAGGRNHAVHSWSSVRFRER